MDYQQFSVISRLDGMRYDCRFHTLATGISPRHSDTVDVKFLVNGRPVIIAIPHAALTQYRRRTARPLTDAEIIQMAGLFLNAQLEKEGLGQEKMMGPSPEETIELAGEIHALVGN